MDNLCIHTIYYSDDLVPTSEIIQILTVQNIKNLDCRIKLTHATYKIITDLFVFYKFLSL